MSHRRLLAQAAACSLVSGLLAVATAVVVTPTPASALPASFSYGTDTTVAIAATPSGTGAWTLAANGVVHGTGGATVYGSAPSSAAPIAIAGTATGHGYWVATATGDVFHFGDAAAYGSMTGHRLSARIVGMAPTADRKGYWLLGADGGIFSFGDAHFYGSTGNMHLNQPVVGMSATATGHGYWLVARDGGIFSYGDAHYHGSTGNIHLNAPIVDMSPSPTGGGYRLLGSDGGIFSFGDVAFYGSLAGVPGTQAAGMSAFATGYWIATTTGATYRITKGWKPPNGPPTTGPYALEVPGSPPLRWNPCHPVRYEVNFGNRSYLTTLNQAIAKVHAATGLTFTYAGTTTATSAPDSKADLLVTWGGPMAGSEWAVTQVSWMWPTPPSTKLFFTHATIVLDKSRPMVDGWGQWNSVGALFLHELGHAVGLAHVTDTHQIMYPVVPVETDYQNGDREGLWMVGSHWGC